MNARWLLLIGSRRYLASAIGRNRNTSSRLPSTEKGMSMYPSVVSARTMTPFDDMLLCARYAPLRAERLDAFFISIISELDLC